MLRNFNQIKAKKKYMITKRTDKVKNLNVFSNLKMKKKKNKHYIKKLYILIGFCFYPQLKQK